MLSLTSFASLITALVLLSGQSMAAPRRTCKTFPQYTAGFDKENYVLGTVLPLLQPVGTHGSLTYHGFVGLNDLTNGGVQAHSKPNEIVTGLPQSLTDGTAYLAAAAPTTYFDLKSFYFGCALDTLTGILGAPTACTITATGYYQGKQHIVQQFDYTPVFDGLLSAPQSRAKSSKAICHTGFMGVDKVEFTSDNPTLMVLLLDDVSYIPHHCTS